MSKGREWSEFTFIGQNLANSEPCPIGCQNLSKFVKIRDHVWATINDKLLKKKGLDIGKFLNIIKGYQHKNQPKERSGGPQGGSQVFRPYIKRSLI